MQLSLSLPCTARPIRLGFLPPVKVELLQVGIEIDEAEISRVPNWVFECIWDYLRVMGCDVHGRPRTFAQDACADLLVRTATWHLAHAMFSKCFWMFFAKGSSSSEWMLVYLCLLFIVVYLVCLRTDTAARCWLWCLPCSWRICEGSFVFLWRLVTMLTLSEVGFQKCGGPHHIPSCLPPISSVLAVHKNSHLRREADFLALGVEGCAAVRRFVQSGRLAAFQ